MNNNQENHDISCFRTMYIFGQTKANKDILSCKPDKAVYMHVITGRNISFVYQSISIMA